MRLVGSEIEVRLISEVDLTRNKDVLIDLLEDNFKINFPNINNLTRFAESGYDDIFVLNKITLPSSLEHLKRQKL